MGTSNNISPILSGWKDVANYLGKGVRTVQRYERDLALPVRRPAQKPHGSVIATKVEIDAWVHASSIGVMFPRRRKLAEKSDELAAFKLVVAENRRLREEMAEFIVQLRSTRGLLIATLQRIRTGSNDNSIAVVESQKPN